MLTSWCTWLVKEHRFVRTRVQRSERRISSCVGSVGVVEANVRDDDMLERIRREATEFFLGCLRQEREERRDCRRSRGRRSSSTFSGARQRSRTGARPPCVWRSRSCGARSCASLCISQRGRRRQGAAGRNPRCSTWRSPTRPVGCLPCRPRWVPGRRSATVSPAERALIDRAPPEVAAAFIAALSAKKLSFAAVLNFVRAEPDHVTDNLVAALELQRGTALALLGAVFAPAMRARDPPPAELGRPPALAVDAFETARQLCTPGWRGVRRMVAAPGHVEAVARLANTRAARLALAGGSLPSSTRGQERGEGWWGERGREGGMGERLSAGGASAFSDALSAGLVASKFEHQRLAGAGAIETKGRSALRLLDRGVLELTREEGAIPPVWEFDASIMRVKPPRGVEPRWDSAVAELTAILPTNQLLVSQQFTRDEVLQDAAIRAVYRCVSTLEALLIEAASKGDAFVVDKQGRPIAVPLSTRMREALEANQKLAKAAKAMGAAAPSGASRPPAASGVEPGRRVHRSRKRHRQEGPATPSLGRAAGTSRPPTQASGCWVCGSTEHKAADCPHKKSTVPKDRPSA